MLEEELASLVEMTRRSSSVAPYNPIVNGDIKLLVALVGRLENADEGVHKC